MNRRVNVLNLWICGATVFIAAANAVLADTSMERVAWLAGAAGAGMGFCLGMTIFHLQHIVRLERKQARFWQGQARRSGAELHRLATADPDG